MCHIFFSQDVRDVQNLPIDFTLKININIFNGFIISRAILQILCDTYLPVAVAKFIDRYVCS
jgi:hypothetical protein